MATAVVFSELYEPLTPEELEQAQCNDSRHGKVFPFRHRHSGKDCAVRFLSIEKLVASWMRGAPAHSSVGDEPRRYAYDIMARAVTVLDGLRHPNLLGLADPTLYIDAEDEDHDNSTGSRDNSNRNKFGGLLKVVTEAGEMLEGQPQEQQEQQQKMEEAKDLFLHLARGLHCLHANLYLHRGIRLSSVARCKNRGGALQLSSFCSNSPLHGTTPDIRVAPEVRRGQAWSAAADIWALGVCFYEYLTGGALPVENEQEGGGPTDTEPKDPVLGYRDEVFASAPGAWDLIVSMLKADPFQRPTVTQVMNHAWLTQGRLERSRALPPDYQDVSLFKGREVSVLRLDRGKSEPPLALSVVAADILSDFAAQPEAVLFVPPKALKQMDAKDGVRTLLGAMLRRPAGCAAAPEDVQQQSPSITPASAVITNNKSLGNDSNLPGASVPPRNQHIEVPQPSSSSSSSSSSTAPGQPDVSVPSITRVTWPGLSNSLWVVPETDHLVDEQALWYLHQCLLSVVNEAASCDGTVLVLPLSLYISRCRSTSRHLIAQELCSLILLLASAVPSARRLRKVVVVTKDVGEQREMLASFHALDGVCLSDAGLDLGPLSSEVATLFQQQAPDVRVDLDLRTYFENLQLLGDDEERTATMTRAATCLQVCLWCGLIGRRLSQLVLERGFQVTEVWSSSGQRCIAVLNHEKVDQDFETLHWNLNKVTMCLGLVTIYDALQSLRGLRALLCVLLLPRVAVDPAVLPHHYHHHQRRRRGSSDGEDLGGGDDEEEEEECVSLDPALMDDCCSERTVVERWCGAAWSYDASRSSPVTWGCYGGESDEGEELGNVNGEEDSEAETDEGERRQHGRTEEESSIWREGLDLLWEGSSWREEPISPCANFDAARPRSWSGGFLQRRQQEQHQAHSPLSSSPVLC